LLPVLSVCPWISSCCRQGLRFKTSAICSRRSVESMAIFAGPDGSAQVRDCADIAASNRQLGAVEAIPDCAIKQRPKGSFNELK